MSDARTLTLALRGRWYGRYGVAFCPAHGNTRSPALRLADGRDGRLLAKCSIGCAFADVAAALRGLGLLAGDGQAPAHDPAADAQRRAAEEAERARAIAKARELWGATLPLEGTLAERSGISGRLKDTESRGDTLAARYLAARAIPAPWPPALRFAPSCPHPGGGRLPAMVAAVTLEGEAGPVAAHRTFLAEPGRKADATPAKAMLGPCAGAAVRLADGPGPLVVAEGVETALSARIPGARVWAGLSAAGVAFLRLPADPGELVVAPDGDAPGMAAAETLATRAAAAGWAVRIVPPPGPGLDWNDAAQEAGPEAAT